MVQGHLYHLNLGGLISCQEKKQTNIKFTSFPQLIWCYYLSCMCTGLTNMKEIVRLLFRLPILVPLQSGDNVPRLAEWVVLINWELCGVARRGALNLCLHETGGTLCNCLTWLRRSTAEDQVSSCVARFSEWMPVKTMFATGEGLHQGPEGDFKCAPDIDLSWVSVFEWTVNKMYYNYAYKTVSCIIFISKAMHYNCLLGNPK